MKSVSSKFKCDAVFLSGFRMHVKNKSVLSERIMSSELFMKKYVERNLSSELFIRNLSLQGKKRQE